MYVRKLNILTVTLTVLCICVGAGVMLGQMDARSSLRLNSGEAIYKSACIACHGPDGTGTPKSIAGFEPPRTFPDFTKCDQTTPEANSAWKAVIVNGGHYRGFSPIMPSFGQALTSKQIDQVIAYLRGFCRQAGWPRGELNLPRAIATEKAYPEDEVVISSVQRARCAWHRQPHHSRAALRKKESNRSGRSAEFPGPESHLVRRRWRHHAGLEARHVFEFEVRVDLEPARERNRADW